MGLGRQLYRFLIFCSGAEIQILDRDECAVERGKYMSKGATVFLTGIFAFISAWYAIQKVLTVSVGGGEASPDVQAISILSGLFWGLMILLLDRSLLASMRKTGSWLRELQVAIPRFMIAILLALVLAKPIEIGLFEDRILLELFQVALEGEGLTQPVTFMSLLEASSALRANSMTYNTVWNASKKLSQ